MEDRLWIIEDGKYIIEDGGWRIEDGGWRMTLYPMFPFCVRAIFYARQSLFGSLGKSMFSLFIMGTVLDDVTLCTDAIRRISCRAYSTRIYFYIVLYFSIYIYIYIHLYNVYIYICVYIYTYIYIYVTESLNRIT